MASAGLVSGSNGSARVSLGLAGAAALKDNHWYMVVRLLRSKTRFPGFKSTIPSIWRLRSGLTIQDVGDRFLFQFDREADRNRALHGGPWFYRNTMLLLGEYDGMGSVEAIPLWDMEIWVAASGLLVALQNKTTLTLIGSDIGQVIRFDQSALRHKEEEQRIRLILDTRHRVRTWMLFEFSPTIAPEINLIYEKSEGLLQRLWPD